MKKTDRYAGILGWFESNMPEAGTELNYANPFQLLVAVILSAQCTDKRVNLTTPELFKRFPDAKTMSETDFDTLFSYIKSISYPNSKTKHLLGMAKMLVSDFNSLPPSDIDELMKIPGVGRKTANVIASIIYDKPVIAVDTHVFRVARRLGLSDGKTVEAVEKELEANIPSSMRARAHHWLILHGRYVCIARKPKCEECGLKDFCRYYALNNIIIQER